jgi:hypothetical protein
MGGMGGGMGGMGGGMGGMGGGMMAVPDDVSLGDKSKAIAPTAKRGVAPVAKAPAAPVAKAPAAPSTTGVAKPAAETPVSTTKAEAVPADSVPAGEAKPAPLGHHRIILPGATEPISFETWQGYFDGLDLKTPEELVLHDQRVLSTVQYLNNKVTRAEEAGDAAKAKEAFVENRDFLAAAILSGHVQPWMHMAYAVALRATGGDQAEIERSLLSAADLADTPEDMLLVADTLRRQGFEASALKLCKDVSAAYPYRREPFVMGLRLAEKLDDVEGLTWACRGILSQAWPKESAKIENDARLIARATHKMLVDQGRKEEADRFMNDLQKATAHDLLVRVSWTGDADVDIAVEEPSGTVCWSNTPNSPGGGTFLGDGFPGLESKEKEEDGILSETYVCPQGFSGTYRILIRRVWGNVTSGTVNIDVLSDIGRPSQRYIRQQVDLSEKDAMVLVAVKEGTRKSEVGEAQLAHLRDLRQRQVDQVLGQFGNPNDPKVVEQFLADMANMQSLAYQSSVTGGSRPFYPGLVPGAAGGPFGFGRAPAVGYMPVITVIPEGAMLFASAIVSSDRRYVRVTPNPMFSQITEINTFNFVSGETGGGGAGGIGGGGGLGGGGLGGGGLGGGGGFF